MAPQTPSIQSFFRPEVPAQTSPKPPTTSEDQFGDGFTSSEVETALHPNLHKWQPRTVYNEVSIGDLVPGPGNVMVTGRIVNFYDQATGSKKPQAAKGCLKVIVKDDTGVFNIKLWYAKLDYELRLGQLVSIWTPHVSNTQPEALVLKHDSITTSIFPERDNSCYFLTQEETDDGKLCKTPVGYTDKKHLAGLITLKNFTHGGHEVPEAKILVCVKSIGGKKTITTKKGNQTEKVDVNVFDDTATATLTLWGCTTSSAASWKSSYTILLLSYPGFRDGGRPTLSLNATTHVDVDPSMTGAKWLRGYAERLTKREHVNPPFPEEVFDVEAATTAEDRVKFTLADLDEFARASPSSQIMGYLSLTILEVNLSSYHQRNMLFCAECCGIPLYANTTLITCKHCSNPIPLRINPRVIGTLLDKTGSLSPGSLIFSLEAWTQLLGLTPSQLSTADPQTVKYLEQRMLFLRVWILFGWEGEGEGEGEGSGEGGGGGKLCVLRVGVV